MKVMIYLLSIKKRLFVFSDKNEFFHNKFEITPEMVRTIRVVSKKAEAVISSCKYQEQLEGAESYSKLLYERYPFAVLINQINLSMIDDLRHGNPFFGVTKLPSMIIDTNDYNDYTTHVVVVDKKEKPAFEPSMPTIDFNGRVN